MLVCMYVCMSVSMRACMRLCMYVHRYTCIYMGMYACLNAHMYICTGVCSVCNVCMYVCMYVCMILPLHTMQNVSSRFQLIKKCTISCFLYPNCWKRKNKAFPNGSGCNGSFPNQLHRTFLCNCIV
jgi:hypothetical protein